MELSWFQSPCKSSGLCLEPAVWVCEGLQRSFRNCEAWEEKQPVLEVSLYLIPDYSVCRN